MKTASQPTASYSRSDWKQGYQSQPNEYNYWIEDIEGEIPQQLHGTLFRNGPGLLDINGQPIAHPFDGDGMVSAITFRDGKAYYQNRFVRTEGFLAEQKAGKILYRGVFGTQKPGGWLANIFDTKAKNIANTHIIYWGGKLLALWEGSVPHQLNPQNLETIGVDHLDGILASDQPFAAHPRIEPGSDDTRLINFSVEPGLSTSITIFEFASDGKLLQKKTHSISGFAFLHDMAITPEYCIFCQNPVQFNPIPYVLGLRGAAQCLRFDPNQPTKIVLIPRQQGKEVKILETDPCFVFHHANAFTEGNRIYLDSICYDYFPNVEPDTDFREINFEDYPAGKLWRFCIDLDSEQVTPELLVRRTCEFPTLHPQNVGQSYRYLYLAATHAPTGNAPLQALLKVDLEKLQGTSIPAEFDPAAEEGCSQFWSLAPRSFAGEPVFVPHPNATEEDDGWVLMLTYNAAHHRSDILIFNAKDISPGPIARLHLKHHVPYGLHGSFVEETFV